MNLTPIRQNMTVLTLNDGTEILFSYRTPVACKNWKSGDGRSLLMKTSKRWSNTTSRHITQWMGKEGIEEKPQEYFDSLIAEVK